MNSSNSGNNNNNNKCNKNNIVLYPLHRNKRAHKHIFRFLLTFKKNILSEKHFILDYLSVILLNVCIHAKFILISLKWLLNAKITIKGLDIKCRSNE